jgi:hypothetical protein
MSLPLCYLPSGSRFCTGLIKWLPTEVSYLLISVDIPLVKPYPGVKRLSVKKRGHKRLAEPNERPRDNQAVRLRSLRNQNTQNYSKYLVGHD